MANEGGSPERFWVKHMSQAVLRLLGGEDIEHLSRELGVTSVALSEWRDVFREGGESGLNLVSQGKRRCGAASVRYFRFHALTRSGASVMDSLNVPIGSIQRILGHENRTTTEIYLHSIGDC